MFNQINYVRWQDRDVVDQTIAEFFQLLPSAYAGHDVIHPKATVVCADNTTTSLRARAWRERSGCVHVVVVNSVDEGLAPQPASFQLRVDGLLSTEAMSAAVIPLWSDCVVNFSSPSMQTYACRSLPLTRSRDNSSGYVFSDVLAATAVKVYRIGCPLSNSSGDRGNDTELVFDGGFEQSQQAGVPGYHLADHSAFWHLDYTDATPGDRDGRAYDDRAWLTIDPRLPRSGRSSLRVFVPTDRGVTLGLPCAAPSGKKSAPRCNTGALMVVNDTTLSVALSVRGWPPGGRAELVTGVFSTPQREWFNVTSVLATVASIGSEWTSLSAVLPSVENNPSGLTVRIRLTGDGPTNFFLDDVTARASSRRI